MNRRRKSEAKTDLVTSPSLSWNAEFNLSLLASRITVSFRDGTLRISDEYAFGTRPKCQTMRSPR